jgi:hypothetical protein
VAAETRPSRRTRPVYRALVLVAAAAAILAVTFLLPEPERFRVDVSGVARFLPLESTDEREFRPARTGSSRSRSRRRGRSRRAAAACA